ncbi:haloacid dehalogenase [Streptomyces sp. NP160]|uniref:HAD family hydrolase n=1 Tax=Streptomyces sp. NP160 TaxID=2586637 RepID=UPI00111B291D|nr:haloacid dehalogenase-like hydrolase [Streptomyces sp. NP160]TNM70306.1 haloacid dehalogenase [Streptomyces sp. NP160]
MSAGDSGGRAAPERLVFFDVDGTLTAPGTPSTGAFLAQLTGGASAVVAAEAAYARGEVTNHQVCDIDAAGFAGLPTDLVEEWLGDLPLIHGIDVVVDHCRRRGWTPVLASLAWTAVTDHLARRFGFAPSGGPVLEVVDGRYTGQVRRYWDEQDKRDAALAVAAAHGVAASSCFAVGDSRSDLPLFAAVGGCIALNASQACAAAALVSLTTVDLRDAIPLLERLATRWSG